MYHSTQTIFVLFLILTHMRRFSKYEFLREYVIMYPIAKNERNENE